MSRRKSAPESPAGIRADQPCKNGQPLVAPDGSCLRCGADQGVACRDVTYHGHKTMLDGTSQPLTSEEAEVIWQAVEAATVKRAERLPTAESALRALLDAQERLRELGWSLGGGLRVRRGDDCAVAQTGSTGIWRGWVDAEGSYVHFGDYCVSPRDAWLKPLSDLTPDELAHMQKCDAEGAAAYSAMIEGLARMETDNG